jgi:hypothetical protein
MQISLEKVTPPVAFAILGIILIVVGASTGGIPIGTQPLIINPVFQGILFLCGLGLVASAIYFVWRELKTPKPENGEEKIQSSTQLLILDENKAKHLFSISSSNDINTDFLCKYIQANQIAKACLIQYSGDNSQRLLRELLEKKVQVRLLLHHPGNLLQNLAEPLHVYQLGKMQVFQRRMILSDSIPNKDCLNIRYYTEPPSLRGIKLDDKFLSLGWYIHHERTKEPFSVWLYGHNNATINLELDWLAAQDLGQTFDRTFESLWKTAVPHTDSKMKSVLDQILALRLDYKSA